MQIYKLMSERLLKSQIGIGGKNIFYIGSKDIRKAVHAIYFLDFRFMAYERRVITHSAVTIERIFPFQSRNFPMSYGLNVEVDYYAVIFHFKN